jgi:mannitol-1-phosphate/altronate dehydrogenase
MSVGSFHRSHQAVYFDDLAHTGDHDWGIVGIGLGRPRLRAALEPQNGLYTVVTRGADRDEARVVGAMTSYHLAPEEELAALAVLADERTALVTLTVTAAAYELDGERSGGAVELLARALDRRRRAGRAPFTVLSCDNLPENGALARRAVVSFAAAQDERLAGWIDEHVAFPNGMVDRITPQTDVADREALRRDFGVIDRWPVVTEAFSQWILEDDFCNRRPALESVGARFVEDVAPYALLKTRLLNASHCALGFLGTLAGLRSTHEAMRDPVLYAYVQRFMDTEVTPLLPRVPGVDLGVYKRTLCERLANPRIGDSLQRLCRAASSKVPAHVVPSIAQARSRGTEHRLLTMAVAAWFRYLRGADELGRRVAVDDPLAEPLVAAAVRGGNDPRPLLDVCPGFASLREDDGFAAALASALADLDRWGVRVAVGECLVEARRAA